MRCFFVFLFLLAAGVTNAQQDSSTSFSHTIGGGFQFLSGRTYDGVQTSLEYQSPLPFFFYRAAYNYNKKHKLLFQASVFERKGKGSITEGGLGGGATYQGNFDCYRAEISIDKGWTIGPSSNGLVALGVSFAGLLHASGKLVEQDYGRYANTTPKEVDVRLMINDGLIAAHLEISGRIRTGPGWILLGLRAFYGGADAFKAKAAVGVVAIIGYQFGKG